MRRVISGSVAAMAVFGVLLFGDAGTAVANPAPAATPVHTICVVACVGDGGGEYDIAILKLASAINIGGNVGTIGLPGGG